MSDLKLVHSGALPEKPPQKKPITPAQQRRARIKAFRPFAVELGWILFEWNGLHEGLCQIFADFSSKREVAYAIWHSTPNDRAQREMLRCAINAVKSDDPCMPALCEGSLWVLDRMEALAGRRNDAIHAPLVFVNLDGVQGGLKLEIEPFSFSGNPRARNLNLPDDAALKEEFMWYRDHLEKISRFVSDLHWAWLASDHEKPFPWPHKPQLPSRGQFANRATKHRKNGSK
jgi:hypothetical protein